MGKELIRPPIKLHQAVLLFAAWLYYGEGSNRSWLPELNNFMVILLADLYEVSPAKPLFDCLCKKYYSQSHVPNIWAKVAKEKVEEEWADGYKLAPRNNQYGLEIGKNIEQLIFNGHFSEEVSKVFTEEMVCLCKDITGDYRMEDATQMQYLAKQLIRRLPA